MKSELTTSSLEMPVYRNTATVLVAVSVYTIAAVGVLQFADELPTFVRLPLALPLFIFMPGYAVLTALFPTYDSPHISGSSSSLEQFQGGFSALERGILAIVTSIAVVPMVVLGVNAVEGVEVDLILPSLALTTVVTAGVGLYRISTNEAAADTPHRTGQPRASESGGSVSRSRMTNPLTLLALAITVLLLLSSAAIAFTGNSSEPLRTEFYLVNESATDGTNGSQQAVQYGGQSNYSLRIKHHRDSQLQYTVVVLLDRDPGTRSQLTGKSTTVLQQWSTTVDPNETTAHTYHIHEQRFQTNGTLRFLLYKGVSPEQPTDQTPHRMLEVSVNSARR